MDDKRQSFASTSIDFVSNLFGVNLNTPPPANDYMQYMHPTHSYNESGSSSNAFKMNTMLKIGALMHQIHMKPEAVPVSGFGFRLGCLEYL